MDTVIYEEDSLHGSELKLSTGSLQPLPVCKCLISSDSSQEEVVSERKKFVFSTVSRTENYLRERRIPELIRFLITKIITNSPSNPAVYTAKLLDECMLFRAGLGVAPVLYEDRHLEAVVKSFDPSQRGWLSPGQLRRAFTTLGLTPEINLDEKVPTHIVLHKLRRTQERELFRLLAAGVVKETYEDDSESENFEKV